MTKKNISLLIPTRGRPSLVYRLFDSILETASDPDSLEIVLYIDDDDTNSHGITHDALSIVKLVQPSNTMGNMLKACYSASSGQYVLLLNDDVIFRTPNWDTLVQEPFTRVPDDIALVYGNDGIMGENLATFPIISRVVCELMNGICPQEYKRDFIDTHILDTFKRLSLLGYERVVYLPDIIFDHIHYFSGKAELDSTYLRNRSGAADDMLFISLCEERQQSAVRITKYIKVYKSSQESLNVDSLVQELNQSQSEQGSTKRYVSKHMAASDNRIAGIFSAMQVVKEACSKILFDGRLPFKWRLKQFVWIVSRRIFIFGGSPFIWKVKLFLRTTFQKILAINKRL